MPRKLFVTTALPYANAPFHIGHMMEYIQADIWVRFQRMQGHEVHFVCADDAHGAPIMIAAEKAGKTPQQFVAEIAAGRKEYLDGFHISLRQLAARPTRRRTTRWPRTSTAQLRKERPDRACKTIEQFFDPVKAMFLPDRYIKGECPVLRRQGPVRRQLRGLRRGLRADRPEEPVLGADRRHAGAEVERALLLPALVAALPRLPEGLDAASRAGCSPRC